jgi:hypothetical protein
MSGYQAMKAVLTDRPVSGPEWKWTRDGRLRHPRFEGLRFDKPARDVVREEPT